MSLFSRKPKVGAPQVQQVTVGNKPLPAYPAVVVQPGAALPNGSNAQETILRHLAEIATFPPGQQLLQGIQMSGKQVGIKYMGPGNNQAAGAARAYYVLRMNHDAQNRVAFSTELGQTIHRMTVGGRDMNWLGNQLYQVTIPTWAGALMASPFRNLPVTYFPAIGGTRPAPHNPAQRIVNLVNQYVANAAFPGLDEMDALALVLEPWMQAGPGVASRINYDPHKTVVNGLTRPPQCGLYHELVHAYYNAIGKQLGREDSLNEGNGGRLFEAMAVGMGPFAARPISENQFRQALGVPLRNTYP